MPMVKKQLPIFRELKTQRRAWLDFLSTNYLHPAGIFRQSQNFQSTNFFSDKLTPSTATATKMLKISLNETDGDHLK